MKKMLYVAGREFAATVTTKGFVFGILFTPKVGKCRVCRNPERAGFHRI